MDDEAMKEATRRYVSHWAFLPLGQFSDDDSLKAKRVNFGSVSKMGMLVDATFPQELDFYDDEMVGLDTVDDFVVYLKAKKCGRVNLPAPEVY
jgi:hypothetical protein